MFLSLFYKNVSQNFEGLAYNGQAATQWPVFIWMNRAEFTEKNSKLRI
jgi:hypothetical protein